MRYYYYTSRKKGFQSTTFTFSVQDSSRTEELQIQIRQFVDLMAQAFMQ
jgi:hypothetical protein